mmetsp:Transcript_39962/g.120424  ORF Transcript_39962/g.120424 Transcript_39962/m.120424 type:complete len:190 (-) Transcript_39962:123-692(-)
MKPSISAVSLSSILEEAGDGAAEVPAALTGQENPQSPLYGSAGSLNAGGGGSLGREDVRGNENPPRDVEAGGIEVEFPLPSSLVEGDVFDQECPKSPPTVGRGLLGLDNSIHRNDTAAAETARAGGPSPGEGKLESVAPSGMKPTVSAVSLSSIGDGFMADLENPPRSRPDNFEDSATLSDDSEEPLLF